MRAASALAGQAHARFAASQTPEFNQTGDRRTVPGEIELVDASFRAMVLPVTSVSRCAASDRPAKAAAVDPPSGAGIAQRAISSS